MFEFVLGIVARLMSRGRPLDPPADPYAAVRQPRGRGPGGRNAAVAVAEPEPAKRVNAIGTGERPGRGADPNEDSH